MTTREQVIHELAKRYPYPWRVEWWLTDLRCGARVSLHGGRETTCGIAGQGIRGARLERRSRRSLEQRRIA
jgi:hypothetical protein